MNGHLDKACEKLKEADSILIGAGAGLSASAGLDYAGPAFQKAFADYISRYGFTDLYSSGFFEFASEEERWAYWARHVDFARYSPPALPLYLMLRELVEKREYFVLTTNVDGQFIKAGFDPDRIFAVQGDYAEMQCQKACHPKIYSNARYVEKILLHSRNMTVDPAFVPICPHCHGPMDMHLRKDQYFIEDEYWHKMASSYEMFLEKNANGKIFLLEIGVGFNTPGIIRYPFENMARLNPHATLCRINMQSPESHFLLPNLITLKEDAGEAIASLLNCEK